MDLVEQAGEAGDHLLGMEPRLLQRLLAVAVRAYVRRVESGERISPFPTTGQAVTVTDVLVAVTDMLAASEIELFELSLWQAWGGIRPPGGCTGPRGTNR